MSVYRKGDTMKKRIIPLLVLLCAVSTTMMIVALHHINPNEPKFVPPDFDQNAQVGAPHVPEELGWAELYQDGMSFKVGICGNLILDQKEAAVYFYNHESNTVWLKLRVMDDQGRIVAETGLLKPAEYLQTIQFNQALKNGDKLKLKIMAYQPDTYYSEGAIVLNTRIQTGG